jgi:hypothetical protein
MRNLWQKVKDLLTAPVVGQVDTVHLWALIGIVLIGLIIWGFVLRHIRLAAMDL